MRLRADLVVLALVLGCGGGGPCPDGPRYPCAAGFYCPQGGCRAPEQCVPEDLACLADWAPVCGCDGKTYSNDCVAQEASVPVAHPGECSPASVVARSAAAE